MYRFGAHNILKFCHYYARYLLYTVNGYLYTHHGLPVGYPGITRWADVVPESTWVVGTRIPDKLPDRVPA